MSKAKNLLLKFNETTLNKNQKKLLTMYVEAINHTEGSFMLCKLQQIKEGIQYEVNNLSKVMLDVNEAKVFHAKADALLSTFKEMLTEIDKFQIEVMSETKKMETMGITRKGVKDDAEPMQESYVSEGQKGKIHVMIDLGFQGLCADKDKIENVFNKRRAQMLKGLDADFAALGLNKDGKS